MSQITNYMNKSGHIEYACMYILYQDAIKILFLNN